MTVSPEQFLREFADDIVFRCFAQGQYWGSGLDRDPEAFNEDYKPENPIDRGEAVKLLIDEFNRLLKLREDAARKDAVLQMTVGSVHDAELASKLCFARTKQGAYIEGFRFARNNLQTAKNAVVAPNNTSNTLEDEVTG